jgi:hypothetical protein
MKYYCIEPATKDKDGVCVLPPLHESVNPSDFDHIDTKVLLENFAPLEKFPTSCDRVGWFSGELDYQIFSGWDGWTSEIRAVYDKTDAKDRRKFIVPKSEEKDVPSIPNWEVSNDPLVNKFLNEKNMIPYDQKITDLLEDFSKWQQGTEAGKQNPVEQKDEPKDEYAELCKEITRLQEKYDENGYDCPPIIKLQRMEQHIDLAFENFKKMAKVEPQPALKEEELKADWPRKVFNEKALLQEVIKVWGEYGAHADVLKELIKRAATKTYTESEVREIVGRTWERCCAQLLADISLTLTNPDNLKKAGWNDSVVLRAVGETIKNFPFPDKETFINGLFPPQNQNNDKKI